MGCLRADGAEPKPCAAIVRRRKQAIHLLLKRRTRTCGHCAAISIFRDGWVRRSRKSALIGRRHRSGQVVDAATADPKRLGLLGDRQIMGAVDHRFALSRPALLSAPDKKSLVSVNSPILACSVFTSTAGVDGSDLGSEPNTPAAPSRS